MAKQIKGFKQVKGFILFGESTFEFCQHLSGIPFEKGPVFLGLQKIAGLLTIAGNRRCGIRIQEGVNLSFLSNGFLPLFKCKTQATLPLTAKIRLLGEISLFETTFVFL